MDAARLRYPGIIYTLTLTIRVDLDGDGYVKLMLPQLTFSVMDKVCQTTRVITPLLMPLPRATTLQDTVMSPKSNPCFLESSRYDLVKETAPTPSALMLRCLTERQNSSRAEHRCRSHTAHGFWLVLLDATEQCILRGQVKARRAECVSAMRGTALPLCNQRMRKVRSVLEDGRCSSWRFHTYLVDMYAMLCYSRQGTVSVMCIGVRMGLGLIDVGQRGFMLRQDLLPNTLALEDRPIPWGGLFPFWGEAQLPACSSGDDPGTRQMRKAMAPDEFDGCWGPFVHVVFLAFEV
ncbi:hypothetical protein VTK56DRAFT_7628 [Thermocarpiscus australiensis]